MQKFQCSIAGGNMVYDFFYGKIFQTLGRFAPSRMFLQDFYQIHPPPPIRGESASEISFAFLKIKNFKCSVALLPCFTRVVFNFTLNRRHLHQKWQHKWLKMQNFQMLGQKIRSLVCVYLGFYIISPPVEGKLHQKQSLQRVEKKTPGRFVPSRVSQGFI